MTTTLVDFQVGPYDSTDKIKAEIERIKALGDDAGVKAAVAQLEIWLKQ